MAARKKDRFGELTEYVRGLGPAAVALSGGVDSGLVALAAFKAHGPAALAVTAVTELTPPADEARAAAVAANLGIRHEVIRLSVLGIKGLPKNPPGRCYLCKKAVFRVISRLAKKRGLKLVLDGTNAEDAVSYRPGLKALEELGVSSPLAELGFGKAEIRKTARTQGLINWDAPSRPCLATRFPYGDTLDPERIGRVQAAEEFVASLGFTVFRVRDHGAVARLELQPGDMPRALARGTAKKIVAKLESLGYNYVTLDLAGFASGSMDRSLVRRPEGRRK